MAELITFANNAQSNLAGSINNLATTLSVSLGQGTLFPAITAGQVFFITLTDVATQTDIEIMKVTAVSGDTFTVVRGQEGTSAQSWTAGDIVNNRWTAGQAAAMLQQGQAQSQSTNYAVDVGAANAYQCTLTPSISSPVVGMPIRVKIANSNTTASTFNPGSGAAGVRRRDGSNLIGGEIVAGDIVEFKWDGAHYLIEGIAPATNAAALAQVDIQSAITPANLFQAFPNLYLTNGYWITPGPLNSRFAVQWGQTVVNSGTGAPITFSTPFGGGLLCVTITANFVISGAGFIGPDYIDGGGPAGFTLHNQTGSNGSYNWLAIGRV